MEASLLKWHSYQPSIQIIARAGIIPSSWIMKSQAACYWSHDPSILLPKQGAIADAQFYPCLENNKHMSWYIVSKLLSKPASIWMYQSTISITFNQADRKCVSFIIWHCVWKDCSDSLIIFFPICFQHNSTYVCSEIWPVEVSSEYCGTIIWQTICQL